MGLEILLTTSVKSLSSCFIFFFSMNLVVLGLEIFLYFPCLSCFLVCSFDLVGDDDDDDILSNLYNPKPCCLFIS